MLKDNQSIKITIIHEPSNDRYAADIFHLTDINYLSSDSLDTLLEAIRYNIKFHYKDSE